MLSDRVFLHGTQIHARYVSLISSGQKYFLIQRHKIRLLRPVHTTPEESENRGFTPKMYQIPVHTTPKEFEKATMTFLELRFSKGEG